MRARGAAHVFFKYCSTFDSTDAGNIGPVADALLARSGADIAIYCPAYPGNERRVFGGYLFVGDVLLSESGRRDHPITPMRDANLVRVLGRQTPQAVDRIDLRDVRAGGPQRIMRSCSPTTGRSSPARRSKAPWRRARSSKKSPGCRSCCTGAQSVCSPKTRSTR